MTMDIAMLGLGIDARPIRQGEKALQDFEGQSKKTEAATERLAKSTDFLNRLYKDLAKALATFKILELAKEAVMLSARFETLGVVMNVAGNNAGYTRRQMAEFEKQMQATGISMVKSREALASLATANIDLAKASALARASQDLAVVAGINSSDALLRVVHGIKSGETEVLKTMGLNVQWEAGYRRLAVQLGKNRDALTEHEKTIARTNTVLVESKKYQGIYEESMTTAGKAITSLTRYFEDLKVKAGEVALPALALGVQRLTEALKEANAQLDRAGSSGATKAIADSLGTAFLFVLGGISKRVAEVAYYFGLAGRELGGFAAQATMLAKLDFKGFLGVGKMVSAEGEAAEKALKAYKNGIDGVGASTAVATTAVAANTAATQANADAKERERIAAGEAARKKEEADAKAAKSLDDALKLQKKYDTAYKDARKSIQERTAALMAEEQGQAALTEGQKFALKMLEDLRTGELKLSTAKKAKLAVDLEAYLLQEKQTALSAAVLEHEQQLAAERSRLRNEDYESAEEYMRQQARERIATVSAAVEAVKAAQLEYDSYGKTRAQIADITLARMTDKLARLDAESEIAKSLGREIEQQEKLISILKKTEARDQQVSFWRDIQSAGHSAFMSLANGSRDVATRMRDYFKNIFFEWLYSMTLKKWLVNIGASFTGMTSGAMSNAMGVGGSSGAPVSLLQVGKGIYDAISGGFASLGSTVAEGAQSGINMFGPGSGMYSPAGSGLPMSNAASMAGTAAQYVGGMAAGKMVGSAISGQYGIGNHGSAVVNIGTAIGAIWGPLGAALGGAIGGLINRAFGMGEKKATGTTMTGNFGASGFSGQTNTAWHQDGGWFRSDKNGTDVGALDAAVVKQFTDGYNDLKRASKEFAETLGIDASAIETRSQSLSLTLTADQTANQKAITDFFIGVGDTMARELMPSLSQFSFEGESASATLQRLAGNYRGVDAVLMTLGQTSEEAFGTVGLASVAARERLIAAAGGLDALAAGTVFFSQNFMTEAERMAPIIKDVQASLDAIGQSGLRTNEEFKNVVLGLDKGTEAGANQYAAMLMLAPQFKQMTDYTNALTGAVADNSDALAAAVDIARERADLQDQLDALTMSAADLLDKERNARFESNRGLFDQIQAAQAAKTAAEELAAAIKSQADLALEAAASLTALNASYQRQIDAFLPLAEQRAREVAGMDASTLALYERLEALKGNQAAEQSGAKMAAQIEQEYAKQQEQIARERAAYEDQYYRDEANRLQGLKQAGSDAMAILAKSVEAQKDTVKAAYDAQRIILDLQKSSSRTIYEANKAASDAYIKTETDKNNRLRSLASALQSSLDGMRLESQQGAHRRQAQDQIRRALAVAQATGNLPEADALKAALQTVAQPSQGLFKTFQDYEADFQITANNIAALNALAGGQLSASDAALVAAQTSATLMQSQFDAAQAAYAQQAIDAQAAYELQVAQFDGVLKTAREQLDAALGTNVLLTDMQTALAGFGVAVQSITSYTPAPMAAPPAPVDPLDAKLTALYQNILGREPDAEGFAWWKQRLLEGAPLDAVAGDFYKSPEFARTHGSHAGGLDRVPFNGYRATLHKDEAVLTAREATAWRAGGQTEAIANRLADLVMVAERTLDALALQAESIDKTKMATENTERMLRRVTRGGEAMVTTT